MKKKTMRLKKRTNKKNKEKEEKKKEEGEGNMEREIAKKGRKEVKEQVLKEKGKKVSITHRNLEKYLGVKRFRYGRVEENDQVGQVTGLAWTVLGGELLTI